MKLIEHLKAKESKDRETLVQRYRQILTAADAATPEEVRELQGIMLKLGHDSERVAKDADAIATRRKLLDIVADEADALKRMDAARQKHSLWAKEAERIFGEMEAKRVELLNEKHEAERIYGACRNAHRKLVELDSANMELFDVDDDDLRLRKHAQVGGAPNMTLGPLPE
jgi:hypothetical protein